MARSFKLPLTCFMTGIVGKGRPRGRAGVVLKALGIPINMFTVLFAVARTVGWVAQWKEMSEEPVPRICRPRQVFTILDMPNAWDPSCLLRGDPSC